MMEADAPSKIPTNDKTVIRFCFNATSSLDSAKPSAVNNSPSAVMSHNSRWFNSSFSFRITARDSFRSAHSSLYWNLFGHLGQQRKRRTQCHDHSEAHNTSDHFAIHGSSNSIFCAVSAFIWDSMQSKTTLSYRLRIICYLCSHI